MNRVNFYNFLFQNNSNKNSLDNKNNDDNKFTCINSSDVENGINENKKTSNHHIEKLNKNISNPNDFIKMVRF